MRYRTAFFITLAIAFLLAGTLAFLWLNPRPKTRREMTASGHAATAPSAPPAQGMAPKDSAGGADAKLNPVTLTPERMQSIGVKTGAVEYRQVQDEIRTTGNVEVDETRLADVQVRFAGLDSEGLRGCNLPARAERAAAVDDL